MEKTIKFIKNGDKEIPIEDISKFSLTHHSNQNGLVITAWIKPELIDQFDYYHSLKETRKYRYCDRFFQVKIKDNGKIRKLIFNELSKQEIKEETYGINAGTPIARAYTSRFKEIKAEELIQ